MKKRVHEEQCLKSRVITYELRTLSKDRTPDWGYHQNFSFCSLKVHQKGSIQDSVGSMQIDFANKVIGGGTLGEQTKYNFLGLFTM